MLERFKQLLGIGDDAENLSPTEGAKGGVPNNTEGQGEANPSEEIDAKTYEEIFAELVKTAEEEAKKEAEKFQEKTKKMLESEPVPQDSEAEKEREPQINLDENATVNDLLKAVLSEVDKRIQQTIREVLGGIPSGVVESIVRENPALKSVEDEAMRIVEKLPPEAKRRETVEMLMWALKGMKSEAEKRSFASELLESIVGEKRRETNFVPLPYSASEIEDFAQKLRLDPTTLKRRLAEQMMKGGFEK